MGFYIPNELKECKNWVVWDENKIPYNPKTGTKAKTNAPKTWSDYTTAINRVTYGANAGGIGFVLTENDPYIVLDLDHCINPLTGEFSQLATDILERFSGTYTEISQSETGVHIFVRGNFPVNGWRGDGIEIYASGRYIAMTGNAIEYTGIADKQNALDELVALHNIQNPPKTVQISPYSHESATVEETINKILKSRQGRKFELLHGGKWKGRGYKSQSEADQAYINIINHFTGGNDSLTIAILQQGELFKRGKGQRADYIARTIQQAKKTHVERRTNHDKNSLIKRQAKDFKPKKNSRFGV